MQPESTSKRAKLSLASESKAGILLPDSDTKTSLDPSGNATQQYEAVASQLTPGNQYATSVAHTQSVDSDKQLVDDGGNTEADQSNHTVSKTKPKKKKKRKKEDVDEIPSDPTSTSSAPDHLR